jgi:UPF0176 protein
MTPATQMPQKAIQYYVTSFYKFIHLKNIDSIKNDLEEKARELDLRGLWVLGAEGLNSTLAATSESSITEMKSWIQSYFGVSDITFKDSFSDQLLFRRFVVKVRPEIVTLKTPQHFPETNNNHHLSPSEWNQVLKEEHDYVLIDTRNWYETKIGTFKGAVNPKIDVFTEFPKFVEAHQFPKDKKMLIFCTGGIRCEKGIMELQAQGYNNVFQLEGGILKYLEEYPEDQFDGECFVFDRRVALDQNLQPSRKFKLCPHCGQPGELKIECLRCDHEALLCDECIELEIKKETCSKHCASQWQMYPGRKGKHQQRDLGV